jgi:hypothetical protein
MRRLIEYYTNWIYAERMIKIMMSHDLKGLRRGMI